jgi:hypothetical protein
MKKIIIISSVLLTACFSVSAWAAESATMNDPAVNSPSATSPSMNGGPVAPASPGSAMMTPNSGTFSGGQGGPGGGRQGRGGFHPCRHIAEACEAAGFKREKGLFKNCLMPIMHGQTVAGVASIDPKEIAACKQKQEERESKGGGMMQGGGMQGQPSAPSMSK